MSGLGLSMMYSVEWAHEEIEDLAPHLARWFFDLEEQFDGAAGSYEHSGRFVSYVALVFQARAIRAGVSDDDAHAIRDHARHHLREHILRIRMERS